MYINFGIKQLKVFGFSGGAVRKTTKTPPTMKMVGSVNYCRKHTTGLANQYKDKTVKEVIAIQLSH